jgi:hypothetical protein
MKYENAPGWAAAGGSVLIPIAGSIRASLPRGNFGATLMGGVLHVPARLLAVLKSLELATAEEFVSYLQTFPAAFGSKLKWRERDVRAATRQLMKVLSQTAPRVSGVARRPPARRLGARMLG